MFIVDFYHITQKSDVKALYKPYLDGKKSVEVQHGIYQFLFKHNWLKVETRYV